MENFDDELIFDDEFLDNEETLVQDEHLSNDNEHQSQENEDLTSEILRLKGISNPDKIKFEDETGAVVERSWNNLSKEEQLNIIAGNDLDIESQLGDDEIDLLNAIRSSGMDVKSYLDAMIQSQIPQPEHRYKVDDLSDDDLYVLDILEKVGSDNVTDDELTEALENAKQNEVLFKKTVDGLRSQYIQLEKDQEMEEANKQQAKINQQLDMFASSIVNEIRGLNHFVGQDLELSNDDMNELYAFMMNFDENGTSQFGKALTDPATFTRAAFWVLNEDKITEELTKQMQDTYIRGYENAKRDMQGKSKLVFNQQSAKTQNKKQDDQFVDDDEW